MMPSSWANLSLILLFLTLSCTTTPNTKNLAPIGDPRDLDPDRDKEYPILPRALLFATPDRTNIHLSPNGTHISFLAPHDGVPNVWIAPTSDPDNAKPITQDTGRGIHSYTWSYTNKHILYLQDTNLDNHWNLYRADITTTDKPNKPNKNTNKNTNLTPNPNISARIVQLSHKFPTEILVALNDRNPQFHEVYRLNILSGERKLIQENQSFLGFISDNDFKIRLGLRLTPQGDPEYFVKNNKTWTSLFTIPIKDQLTTAILGFTKDNKSLLLRDSRQRNTAAILKLDLTTKATTLIAESPDADINHTIIHPTERTVLGWSWTNTRQQWAFSDKNIQKDFQKIKKLTKTNNITIASRTLDNQTWLISQETDNGPRRYATYNRNNKKLTPLFTDNLGLEQLRLSKMHPLIIPTRDKHKLISYLTLPPWETTDRPTRPTPMVLLVHDGPWSRDTWGYRAHHQWLANRGYAVLSVNFRGSTGFGKNFTNAGDLEWGRNMQNDLLDAVQWAIKEKIARKTKIAIMGTSYGGYTVLNALADTPNTFACGVAFAAPSNLQTFLDAIPPQWAPLLDMMAERIGDPRTPEGQKLLKNRSPLFRAQNIKRPLLIGQGTHDPRVKQQETEQLVETLTNNKTPVIYALYPDEGHGFTRLENQFSYHALVEIFLEEHLGGRASPIGHDLLGSSLQVPQGASLIPGLTEALQQLEKTHLQDPLPPSVK